MSDPYQSLTKRFRRIAQIDHASIYLGWDQMVMMPAGGVAARAQSLAELAVIRHELLTDVAIADELDAADAAVVNPGSELQHAQTASLREMRRSWQQATAMPASLVKAQVVAGARCEHGWRTQRSDNDWYGFLQNFREVVKLSREEALCRQASDTTRFTTPYDALLDMHCAGDSQALISDVFAALKERLPSLLNRIIEKQSGNNPDRLAGQFAIDSQTKLNHRLMSKLGFNFEHGRLDVSMHPFSTGVPGDLRITTRFREDEFADALQATAHETGHASYESGLPESFRGLPVGMARNMSIHESQSLLFEKHLFLSLPFLESFMSDVHAVFPDLKQLSAKAFWESQTVVAPSYIRVEADEVTYPMHVMLRYDIESALINGEIEADVIPEVWDAAMHDYLGLNTKDNHLTGCLQDIHWTDGAFGYFPSYTLGAVNAAQLAATLKQQYPDWQMRIRHGDVLFIRDWLKQNLWQQGSLVSSQQLMHNITGASTSSDAFIEHIENRYLLQQY